MANITINYSISWGRNIPGILLSWPTFLTGAPSHGCASWRLAPWHRTQGLSSRLWPSQCLLLVLLLCSAHVKQHSESQLMNQDKERERETSDFLTRLKWDGRRRWGGRRSGRRSLYSSNIVEHSLAPIPSSVSSGSDSLVQVTTCRRRAAVT